jgi:hypothetical protein
MGQTAADEIFRLSGVIFSRTNTRSKVSGVPYTGIKSFDIADKREGEIVFGQRTSGEPLGITDGVYSVDDWNAEIYADTWEMMCEQLGAAPGANGSFGNARWIYSLTISAPGVINLPTLSLTVEGMKIEGRAFSFTDDAGALLWKVKGKATVMKTRGEGVGLSAVPSYLSNHLAAA